MLTMLRQALSILLLPFMAVVIIPYGLMTSLGTHHYRLLDGAVLIWLSRSLGILLFFAGFLLFSWCVSLFAKVGRGTLAPWDPTHNLVAIGPYRYVRNPMISGVALMLIGETVFWSSSWVGVWAVLFAATNHVYFIVSEEPGLEERFGEHYRRYKAMVPRWIPRLRPWLG